VRNLNHNYTEKIKHRVFVKIYNWHFENPDYWNIVLIQNCFSCGNIFGLKKNSSYNNNMLKWIILNEYKSKLKFT